MLITLYSATVSIETCPSCGGRLRLRALVQSREGITRFLRHLGEPTEPPPRAPARAPPYSATISRRHAPREPAPLIEE